MTFVRFYNDPITHFDRLFGDALVAQSCSRAGSSRRGKGVYRPSLDLHESNDTNTVTAIFELPGLSSNDITIDVHQNRLTVSGEFPGSSSDSDDNVEYVIRERLSGKFSRTLQLPFGTQSEDVKAKVESGLLTITFPKTNPAQEAQRVVVQ